MTHKKKTLAEYESEEDLTLPLPERLKRYVRESDHPKVNARELERVVYSPGADSFETPTGQHRLDRILEIVQSNAVEALNERVEAEREAKAEALRKLSEMEKDLKDSKKAARERFWTYIIGVAVVLTVAIITLAAEVLSEHTHDSAAHPSHSQEK
jgi:phytoene/squalene synthetase